MGDNSEREYKGPSRTAASVGQGDVDGATGLLVGAIAGGIGGVVMHNEEKHKAAKAVLNNVDALKDTNLARTVWNSMSRTWKGITAAAVVATVVSSVAQIIGYSRGAKKADAALAQFNEITEENKLLRQKLESSEQRIADIKSFAEANKDMPRGNFADRLDKERERTSQEKGERSH